MFSWPRFLESQGITYVTRGPNTGPGQISTRCPMCGNADPSEHMSISLKGSGWRCFRNPRAHSGKARWRLIQALLHCSAEEAHRLAGDDVTATPVDYDMVSRLSGLLGLTQPDSEKPTGLLTLPKEFKPVSSFGVFTQAFWGYTMSRGYTADQVGWLVQKYQLHYAVRGRFAYRLIIPVYDAEGRLMTWTGRTIRPGEKVRYKTLSSQPREGYRGPLAVKPPTTLLLGLPLLLTAPNPEILVLCEGPFDAMRVSALGRHLGVYGTCLFGLNITEAQVLLVERLMVRFRRLVLLLDPDAELVTFRIKDQLLPMQVKVGILPKGVKDPGDLSKFAAQELFNSWLEKV